MSPPRKFDWDRAKLLRARGWSWAAMAREFGVSPQAVMRACDSNTRNRMDLAVSIRQRSGVCTDCGKQCSRNDTYLRRGISKGRCRECAAKHKATTVRDDALQCVKCKQWLWDTSFPHNKAEQHRRGRHTVCTACGTEAKRDWRRRNREHANAYQREYRRARRLAA